MLSFMGKESRLVLLRNVDYIIEQQKLQMESVYNRKLTNSLSHELLTPLNCIVNLSEDLLAKQTDLLATKTSKKHLEKVWSSGKILDFTIRSMINR